MREKDIRLDNLENANDFDYHREIPQNTSEFMKKNLLIELDAQGKKNK